MIRTPDLHIVSTSAVAIDRTPAERAPLGHDPAQWHQAIGVARQACARIFRDGGTAADAIRAFGLALSPAGTTDWSRAVEQIAASLCTQRVKRAA